MKARLALPSLLVVALSVGCRRGPQKPGSPGAASLGSALASSSATSSPADRLLAAQLAADRRESRAVPLELAGAPDVAARRASARALAEIADPAAIERLGHALSDDDAEVVAWAAYGIALPCDVDAELPREDRARIVRALAARALTLPANAAGARLDPWGAIGWGLGRCGGVEASRELARWLPLGGPRARVAAFALGAVAQRDHGLEDDVAQALVAAAEGSDAGAPVDDALYPFGRGDWADRPPVPRLGDVARARLATTTARAFAIRALGRRDAGKAADLRPILADPATAPSELVEALRSLHRLGADGDAEIAAFATRGAPTDDDRTKALVGDRYGALHVALELLADGHPSATVTTSLRAFVSAAPIGAALRPTLARRLAALRCLAAVALHPGAPGDAEVVRCAVHEAAMPAPLAAELDALRDDARLTALGRADLTGERREFAVRLARDGSLRVRERALGVLAAHPEAEAAPEVVARALAAKELGLVASAALAIAARPSIAEGPSRQAIHDALDPAAPPPKGAPTERTVDAAVKKALAGALARPMDEADAEIRIDLAAAVGALREVDARAWVMRLCTDRGPALRRAGRRALERLDPPGTAHACDVVTDFGDASPLAGKPSAPRVLDLDTDVGALTLSLDPSIAPLAVARVAELAAAGFYDGLTFHRVVPGFVVQLGDPQGDGFGGARSALRCETAPVPFAALDVGVALAGRDTGSSQIFVTLAPTPHLDGSYAWLGHASGAWAAIAEGDPILKVRVR